MPLSFPRGVEAHSLASCPFSAADLFPPKLLRLFLIDLVLLVFGNFTEYWCEIFFLIVLGTRWALFNLETHYFEKISYVLKNSLFFPVFFSGTLICWVLDSPGWSSDYLVSILFSFLIFRVLESFLNFIIQWIFVTILFLRVTFLYGSSFS